MKKILFFFTATYPFGTGETFIENEITYLAQSFDSIIIVSNNTTDTKTRKIPDNVKLERLNYELSLIQKIYSLKNIFHPLFWKEISIIRKKYALPLSKLILTTALQTLQKAISWHTHIASIIQKHTSPEDSVYLYSYWNNDTAVALSHFYNTHTKKIHTCISRAHGWDVYFEVNKAQYLPYRQYILEKSNGVYFIAKKGACYYEKLFPEYLYKIHVSHLGVKPQNTQKNKDFSHIRIVSCSNIIPVKRVDLIAQTLEKISPTISIEWIHFGTGNELDKVQAYCNTHLDDKAHISYFFAGRKSNTDIIQYYKTNYIDLFINLSSSEGIPVSIMEAQSFGIPCIATNVGGTGELITHTRNGILIPAHTSSHNIAQAIESYIALPEYEQKEYRKAAHSKIHTQFNAEKNYIQFIRHTLLEA
ncbi:MAG: glycosyltransferase [Bacteroidales bacterium]